MTVSFLSHWEKAASLEKLGKRKMAKIENLVGVFFFLFCFVTSHYFVQLKFGRSIFLLSAKTLL